MKDEGVARFGSVLTGSVTGILILGVGVTKFKVSSLT